MPSLLLYIFSRLLPYRRRLTYYLIQVLVPHILGLYFPPGAAHGKARCPAAADAAERRGVDGPLLRPTAVRPG
jgi:hypothetical protein